MTKQESLEFLEFLTLPTDTRYTVQEVKHLLRSEPLRSELKAKVQTRLASSKKSHVDNSPNPMKSKKPHEPQYTRSHPLEKPSHTFHSERKIHSRVPSTTRSRSNSTTRSRSQSRRRVSFSSRSTESQGGNRKSSKNRSRSRTPSRPRSPRAREQRAKNRQEPAQPIGLNQPSPSHHAETNQKKALENRISENHSQVCSTECQSRIVSINDGIIVASCLVCHNEKIFHPVSMKGEDDVLSCSDTESEDSDSASECDQDSDDVSISGSEVNYDFLDGRAFIASELDEENNPHVIPILSCESSTCALHNPDESDGVMAPVNQHEIAESDLNSILTDSDRFYETDRRPQTHILDSPNPFELPPPMKTAPFF